MKFEKNVLFKLPLIISRGAVMFPKYPDYIFVERKFSVNAINISRTSFDFYVILVTQKNISSLEILNYDDFYHVGTLCKISQVNQVKGGYRCKLTPIERIVLDSYQEENETFFGNAFLYEDLPGEALEEEVIIKELFKRLESESKNVFVIKNSNKELIDSLSKGLNAKDVSYVLSNFVDCSLDEKQKLLEAKNVNIRLTELINVLNEAINKAKIEEKLQNDIRDSTDKNQREYYLREKLKAIKKELGEDGDENSPTSILKKVDEGNYPENIKNKVHEEIKKYEMLPQGSLESSLIQTYVSLLMSLPYNDKSIDNDNLSDVKRILNEDHYGLKKAKERIIEYLAVKQMTGNLKAPILCFYGPPGTGKTSLAKSIARALGRNFVKASLGGVSDEAEIRGFKRTYVGSAPGKIIQGIKKAKTCNPVFLLDEIDKLDKSYHGSPASAMLEVLDPEQNQLFTDNFIEEPFDLSNVLFICTANYLENIPAPLLDRLELIELNSYTAIEKLHIAKEHLVQKAIQNNGLLSSQINFTDNSLDFLIERYTRESGVRELERLINTICRKVCVEMLDKKIDRIEITPHDVKTYLGVEIFDSTKKENGGQVGVVTGLAYTQFGGDILPIEVNYFDGKGDLVLTGKLGDVMKESCKIALDYIRANAKKYKINPEMFSKYDIHVHVPEGAVPKDGPSAGVAITIAIISSLTNKPVSGDIAMTGEVTLRGNVLPIGGLREKSLAALRSGIKTIIVPLKNKNNVNELPDEVKENLNIIYMSTVDEALKHIFKK